MHLQIAAIEEIEAAHDRIATTFGTDAGRLRAGSHWQRSKTAGYLHIIKIAQVVADPNVIEHAAQPAQRNAHPIRAAEPAELAAAFHVRLQVEKYARHAALFQLLLDRRNQLLEVAQHEFVAAVAAISGDKVL